MLVVRRKQFDLATNCSRRWVLAASGVLICMEATICVTNGRDSIENYACPQPNFLVLWALKQYDARLFDNSDFVSRYLRE